MPTPDHNLQVSSFAVEELALWHQNPRLGDTEAIAKSLCINGQYRPIVVNVGTHTGRPLEVLAGNHTTKAHRFLAGGGFGAQKHPDGKTLLNPNPAQWATIAATTVDVDDIAAARIVAADNRTADLGSYDDRKLADLLQELAASPAGLEGTGYADDDLAALLDSLNPAPAALVDPDAVPMAAGPPTSTQGDVWQMGWSRLVVGDPNDPTVWDKLLDGSGQPSCVWTDPRFPAAAAEVFTLAVARCSPGSPIYIAHNDVDRVRLETDLLAAGVIVRQNLIWVDTAKPAGDRSHQPILYGFTPSPDGGGRLGRGGKRWYGDDAQTTVFEAAGINDDEHPRKPVALIQAMLTNSVRRHATVLDPYAGSGSTLIAADAIGMDALLIELDPVYADVIVRRWQETTGHIALLNGEPCHLAIYRPEPDPDND